MKLGLSRIITPQTQAIHAFHAANLANLTTGLITLPAWMAITCATTNRSTQTGAATIVTGLGANAARARNAGGGTGLSVERAATNLAVQSNAIDSLPWASIGGVVINANAAVSPDGASNADEIDISVGTGRYQTPAGNDGSVTVRASIWGKQSAGANTHILEGSQDASGPVPMVLTTAWQRFETTLAASATNGHFIINSSGSKKGYYAHAQTETGKYPTSVFPTTTASRARAADVLSVAAPKNVAPGGFFNLDMTVAPNYTQAEQAADHNLVYFDANNRVYIEQSTHKVILRIGGSNILSSALTWARETPIRIRAQHTRHGRRLVITGASSGNGDSGLQSASAAMTLPATSYLMGGSSGAEECADLQTLLVYRP